VHGGAGVTGYLIGSPLSSASGEASDHFSFGYIRFAHFAAAYIFAVMFVMRVVWAFLGNKFSREIFLGRSRCRCSAKWWRGLIEPDQALPVPQALCRPWQGHNPLAQAGMFFMYVLGTVFMICTGFALYGEGLGMNSWAYQMFSSWVLPMLGFSQNVHTLHHLGMWYLLVFTIIHLYMVTREDMMSGESIISTMINGWRVAKK
jgi:Ni/Fe-hydrogenase 1 B-type cytochrome subunit